MKFFLTASIVIQHKQVIGSVWPPGDFSPLSPSRIPDEVKRSHKNISPKWSHRLWNVTLSMTRQSRPSPLLPAAAKNDGRLGWNFIADMQVLVGIVRSGGVIFEVILVNFQARIPPFSWKQILVWSVLAKLKLKQKCLAWYHIHNRARALSPWGWWLNGHIPSVEL